MDRVECNPGGHSQITYDGMSFCVSDIEKAGETKKDDEDSISLPNWWDLKFTFTQVLVLK